MLFALLLSPLALAGPPPPLTACLHSLAAATKHYEYRLGDLPMHFSGTGSTPPVTVLRIAPGKVWVIEKDGTYEVREGGASMPALSLRVQPGGTVEPELATRVRLSTPGGRQLFLDRFGEEFQAKLPDWDELRVKGQLQVAEASLQGGRSARAAERANLERLCEEASPPTSSGLSFLFEFLRHVAPDPNEKARLQMSADMIAFFDERIGRDTALVKKRAKELEDVSGHRSAALALPAASLGEPEKLEEDGRRAAAEMLSRVLGSTPSEEALAEIRAACAGQPGEFLGKIPAGKKAASP